MSSGLLGKGMRGQLCTVCILLLALRVSNVCCEGEDEDDNYKPWWKKFVDAFKNFVRDVQEAMKDFMAQWEEKMKDPMKWTVDSWKGLKDEIYDWIEDYDASEDEKEEMRRYVEKLQMPEDDD